MKRPLCAGLGVVLLWASAVRAESLPTFHVKSCTNGASHIVVVQTMAAEEGKFKVLESWKGDLEKGTVLKLPKLAKEARGEMVLFLRREGADQWRSANSFEDWSTSVAWLDGDKVSAVEQPFNPGPAEVRPIPGVESRKEFKEVVASFVRTERAFEDARAMKDLDRRVEALAAIVNEHSDRQEEAFAELGKCGPKALPSLRKFLDAPPNHQQQYAVAALVEAGGKDVVPELNRLLEGELAFWKDVGPKLEKGWWLNTDVEAWKRYSKLMALVAVYRKHPTPALRTTILAVRDYLHTLPAIDGDKGIGSISEYCDQVLKGENK